MAPPVEEASHEAHQQAGGQGARGVHARDYRPAPSELLDVGVDESGDAVGLARPGEEQSQS